MKISKIKVTVLWGIILLLAGGVSVYSAESENHAVILDSVEISAGKSFVVGINVVADRIAEDEKPGKMGFGSFCIPMKYDKTAFVVDSVTYLNTLLEWDEKFTNPKVDTGFISISGIYDMGGKDNPPIYTPDKQERIVEIHCTANKKAPKDIYKIELTRDPRQDNIFLGSPTGVVSVRPQFKPGIVVIK